MVKLGIYNEKTDYKEDLAKLKEICDIVITNPEDGIKYLLDNGVVECEEYDILVKGGSKKDYIIFYSNEISFLGMDIDRLQTLASSSIAQLQISKYGSMEYAYNTITRYGFYVAVNNAKVIEKNKDILKSYLLS